MHQHGIYTQIRISVSFDVGNNYVPKKINFQRIWYGESPQSEYQIYSTRRILSYQYIFYEFVAAYQELTWLIVLMRSLFYSGFLNK